MGPGYYFVVEAGIVFGTVKVDGAGYEHDGPVAMLVGKVCGYGEVVSVKLILFGRCQDV